MLTPHRRHLKACEHAPKGWNYTLCNCPVWCDGMLDGQRVTRSLQTSNWERALRRIQTLEAGGATSPEIRAAAPSLGKAAEAFLKAGASRNLRESTLASYRRTLGHLTKALGGRTIAAVDLPALDAYRAGRTIAATTWRKELETLRAFWAWCKDRAWCDENPAKKLRMPRVDNLTTLPFTADEVQRLLAACDQIASDNPAETPYIRQRARALLYTLIYSGLRISDVAELRRSALESSGHLVLRTVKTQTPQKVLLHADAVAALQNLPVLAGSPYFFYGNRGKIRTCIKNMRRTVQRLGVIAKVHAHPHRFRDTFAVELLTNGTDIRTVQHLLGHTSVRTTEKHYAHFVAAHQKILDSAAATLDFRPKPVRPLLVHPRQNRRRNP